MLAACSCLCYVKIADCSHVFFKYTLWYTAELYCRKSNLERMIMSFPPCQQFICFRYQGLVLASAALAQQRSRAYLILLDHRSAAILWPKVCFSLITTHTFPLKTQANIKKAQSSSSKWSVNIFCYLCLTMMDSLSTNLFRQHAAHSLRIFREHEDRLIKIHVLFFV